jgi:hypothetical protein
MIEIIMAASEKWDAKLLIFIGVIVAAVVGFLLVFAIRSTNDGLMQNECKGFLPRLSTQMGQADDGATVHGHSGPNWLIACDASLPKGLTGQFIIRTFSDGTTQAVVMPFALRIP